ALHGGKEIQRQVGYPEKRDHHHAKEKSLAHDGAPEHTAKTLVRLFQVVQLREWHQDKRCDAVPQDETRDPLGMPENGQDWDETEHERNKYKYRCKIQHDAGGSERKPVDIGLTVKFHERVLDKG